MTALLHWIITIQLTIGPCASAYEAGILPESTSGLALTTVYSPLYFAALNCEPAMEVTIKICHAYQELVQRSPIFYSYYEFEGPELYPPVTEADHYAVPRNK